VDKSSAEGDRTGEEWIGLDLTPAKLKCIISNYIWMLSI
jgi:hypothetical protein